MPTAPAADASADNVQMYAEIMQQSVVVIHCQASPSVHTAMLYDQHESTNMRWQSCNVCTKTCVS